MYVSVMFCFCVCVAGVRLYFWGGCSVASTGSSGFLGSTLVPSGLFLSPLASSVLLFLLPLFVSSPLLLSPRGRCWRLLGGPSFWAAPG